MHILAAHEVGSASATAPLRSLVKSMSRGDVIDAIEVIAEVGGIKNRYAIILRRFKWDSDNDEAPYYVALVGTTKRLVWQEQGQFWIHSQPVHTIRSLS